MKLIIAICAVISVVAVCANGFPERTTEAEFDFDLSDIDVLAIDYMLDGNLPTDDQIQCIKNGVQKIVDDNPELKWWFEEVDKSMAKLEESAKKCASLQGIDQKRCYLKLKVVAQLELRRLVRLLPSDQKDVLEALKGVIKGCME